MALRLQLGQNVQFIKNSGFNRHTRNEALELPSMS